MNEEARRPFTVGDVALYAIGVVGLVACLTLLFLGMRAVMDIGGYCADGGPHEINTHCPEGIPMVMILGVFGLFGFGGLMGWKGAAIGGVYAGLVLLAWPALFLSLGWNFLEFAFNPPGDESGIVWGWLIPGVLFVLMGGLPLLALLPERRPATVPESAELRRTDPGWSTPWPRGQSNAAGASNTLVRAGQALRMTWSASSSVCLPFV